MTSPLTAEEEATYTKIIDGILTEADLETVTRKKIRQGLETAVGHDLDDKKDAIKRLIEARFDAVSSGAQAQATLPSPPPGANAGGDLTFPTLPAVKSEKVNGYSHDDEDADQDEDDAGDDDDDHSEEVRPPTKKLKRSELEEDADARLAAELQAQENRLATGRTTRGGSGGGGGGKAKGGAAAKKNNNKAKAKRKSKSKSEKHVRSSDDEGEGSGSDATQGKEKEKRKAGGGFQKPFLLSPALQEVVGAPQLSRPQVVKKLWEHIKNNNLQDPDNKRQIICDDRMQAVFRMPKVGMFQMNKLLGNHLYPPEEVNP